MPPRRAGATIVADYHTHADYSLADPNTGAAIRTSDPARDDFNSDNFSTQDKRSAKALGYDAYLGYRAAHSVVSTMPTASIPPSNLERKTYARVR
jgi:hypothetical protein